MEKYFCGSELYCNLTPAELICHLSCCSMPSRAFLRKDNSCKNWSKGNIFKTDQKESFLQFSKEDQKLTVTWAKLYTRDDDQLNLIQKIQHTFQCITSTKCNGWKSSMFILQNLLRTTNPENFSSIGQILLKIFFLNGKNNSFWGTSFKLMATEIVKIKLYYLKSHLKKAWKHL